ncbi:hypothetical protein AVEN_166961-1 [Araneus ventricosus]|uniref:Uncharacterized protein n=1 Tax=Araneus ventricosus TaxID=182803 RepID=A0A4Y2K6X2_ARAVE|nr:hypothetical protein AVEN_166961-1 [Araneus ventricosus]
MANSPLRHTKSATLGYSQRKCQNGYRAAESTPCTSQVPRKQINCNCSKNYLVRISKLSVKTPLNIGMSNQRVEVSLVQQLSLSPIVSSTFPVPLNCSYQRLMEVLLGD